MTRKAFDVTIKATVRKTIRVEAYGKEDAIEEAHQLFDVRCDGSEEDYDEQTESVEEV